MAARSAPRSPRRSTFRRRRRSRSRSTACRGRGWNVSTGRASARAGASSRRTSGPAERAVPPVGARIGLVIFDCDGVLVDSEMIACAVEARPLTAAGYPITTAEVAHRYAGVSDADMRRAIEEESGRTLPEDHAARCGAEVEDVYGRELRAVQGIAAVVDAVKESGAQVCIASSSAPERLRLALGLTGLWERFAPHVFSAKM